MFQETGWSGYFNRLGVFGVSVGWVFHLTGKFVVFFRGLGHCTGYLVIFQ